MKNSRWADFLFTVVVRFICGVALGCLALMFFNWKGVLRAFAHDDTRGPLVLLVVAGLVGGIVAVVTVPHWQTPWYKGIRDRDEET